MPLSICNNSLVSCAFYALPVITTMTTLGTILGVITLLGCYNFIGVGALTQLGTTGSWALTFGSLAATAFSAALFIALCSSRPKLIEIIGTFERNPPRQRRASIPPQPFRYPARALVFPFPGYSSDKETVCPIGGFTDEVILPLLSFLPTRDLYTLRDTCHYFRRVATDESLWKIRGERLNDNLGPKTGGLFLRPRNIPRVQNPGNYSTWFQEWYNAQGESQISISDKTPTAAKDGFFFSFYENDIVSISFDEDFKKIRYAHDILGGRQEGACFDVKGSWCAYHPAFYRAITMFSLHYPDEEPWCVNIDQRQRDIACIHLGHNNSFVTGMKKGKRVFLWEIDEQGKYTCTLNLPVEGEVVSVRHTEKYIVYMVLNEEGYAIYLHYLSTGHTGLVTQIPIGSSSLNPTFDLSNELLIIGYDSEITSYDLSNDPFLRITSKKEWAEMHSLHIVGNLLYITFSKNVLADLGGDKLGWLRFKDAHFPHGTPKIQLHLQRCSLTPIIEQFERHKSSSN